MAIQLEHQTLHIDIHQICGWKARLYNQLTAILMPRELDKTLIFVLGQTLPDFLDSNSVYTKCKIKMFLKGTGIWTYSVWGILQLIFMFCQNCYLFILTERQQIFYTMALDMVFV